MRLLGLRQNDNIQAEAPERHESVSMRLLLGDADNVPSDEERYKGVSGHHD